MSAAGRRGPWERIEVAGAWLLAGLWLLPLLFALWAAFHPPAWTTRFDAAGAILLASENAFRVAGEAVQALGGAGYTTDWPVERYLRDAKLLDIGAGTNEIRRMLIGRELIGAAG